MKTDAYVMWQRDERFAYVCTSCAVRVQIDMDSGPNEASEEGWNERKSEEGREVVTPSAS